MKMTAGSNLKTRAVLATAAILFTILAFNTAINIYVTTGRYREALIARTSALAEGIRKDINKAIGFGLPLDALAGMGEKLRGVVEENRDLTNVMIMDGTGRVLYAGDPALERKVLSDEATKKALTANEQIVRFYADHNGGYYDLIMPLLSPEGAKIGVFRVALKKEAITKQVRNLLDWALLVGLVSFLIATGLVSFFMDRAIARPIVTMSKTASLMAAGDLSQEVAIRGETEIAELGGAINTMSSNLREMLGKIKSTGASLNDAMKLIGGATKKMSEGARVQEEAAGQTAMVTDEMVASIKGVSKNAGEMSQAATNASISASQTASSVENVAQNTGALAAAVDDTSSSIEQMIASIRQVSENTDALSLSAEQTSTSITVMSASVKEVEQRAVESARLAEQVSRESSERGMAAAAEAIQGMQNIKETVEATAEVVNRLGKRSREIGQILRVIDEVTDQTGLLALNAAILAAQAGAHGKGFAVVADEIKDLAERTTASTQEIAGLIASVQEETAQSVKAMARGLKAVETGVGLVNVTNSVLEQVSAISRQSADMARAIEKATAEQARGVAQITETSVSVAEQVERIAVALQEQRKGTERIAKAAERMRDITAQVRTATRDQTSGSRQIADAVESVTRQASEVARSTSEQSKSVVQISKAISRIQQITQDNVDVTIEMNSAVGTLRQKADALQAELEGFKF